MAKGQITSRRRMIIGACLAACRFIAFPFSARLFAQRSPSQRIGESAGQRAPESAAANRSGSKTASPMLLREIGREAGLTTMPRSSTERRYIVETMGGGGIALFDCDNEGKLEIALVNDTTMARYLAGGDPMITSYHQDGHGRDIHFTDITEKAGLTARGWGTAIAVGEYDNDGLPDLYVSGHGHNVLYHNLGGCRFDDVTDRAGAKLRDSVPEWHGLITIATASSTCL
jgi:hypothetical protein